jgi:phosphoribosyl 1,2-cyclic phosphate phosphodiesterase|tara:strand:- start:1465 stop:2229 length:765 start_codon:yes stop_codon:yes gene_type:complete
LKVTFLGTGTSTGIPLIGSDHPVCHSSNEKDKRLRSSVLIQWDNYSYIIDTGPDFRQQMLRSKCNRIDGVLYTHEHSDHTSGIDDLRAFCFKQGEIPIYGHKRVIDNLFNRFEYIFNKEKKYAGAPKLKPIEITENKNFKISNLIITPISYLHAKLQVYGYRFNDFAYLTDMKTIEDVEINKLDNLKVLVLNCIKIEPHYSHLNLEEALKLIRLIKPKKTYLTHISHMLGFHEEVQNNLPEDVFLAFDGLEIEL